ncbi:MAG TPA: nitrite reductase small subunit NirD [Acidimicrobiales bacterium]|nr:nitrite reductase small subunit NirD [Acidimicrobiales bacterium]
MSTIERAPAVAVCPIERLDVERGAAALVDGHQVALFRLPDGTVHAVDHKDPATGANVLARGLLGTTAGGEWYVASPLHKHRYSLVDGRCLNADGLSVAVHDVEILADLVHVIIASCS